MYDRARALDLIERAVDTNPYCPICGAHSEVVDEDGVLVLRCAAAVDAGHGMSLVRREYMTAIGPVDLLCKDADGGSVAVEIKRRGEIDGVEQLTRYLELLNRDPLLAPVKGVFAAQEIKPQARVLAADRGIDCVTVDYAVLKGTDDPTARLF